MIPAAPHHQGYRPEIDGLRAIAVLSVIASHAGEPFSHLVRGGFLGVDVFFVLSGYLITGIILRDLARDRFSLTDFYVRRTRRILPALVLVALVSLPAAWILMTPDQMEGFSQSLVGLSFFASNVYFWLTSGYFAPSAEFQPMIHTWSLAVEEQFYLLFPLALLMLWRRGMVLAGLAIALALGLAVAEILARTAPSAAFFLLPARMWELLAGALAGYLVNRYGLPDGTNGPRSWRTIGRYGAALSLAGLALILVPMATYHSWMPLPGLVLVPVIAGTVAVLICTRPGSPVHRGLTLPPMIWIGLISYSAYLWHQPVFAFYRIHRLDTPEPGTMGLLTLVVMLAAWATWAFVEQPFRSRTIAFAPLARGLATASALILAFGVAGYGTSGYASARFSDSVNRIFQTATASPLRSECHSQSVDASCKYFSKAPAQWVVLGDSHGVELAYGLADYLRQSDRSLLHFTQSGCPPALTFETSVEGCGDWLESALERLASDLRPHTVFVAYRHAVYLFGRNEDVYPALPNQTFRIEGGASDAERRQFYWASFEELIGRLRSAGHRVVLVQPVPEIARSVSALAKQYDGRNIDLKNDAPLEIAGVPRSYYEARSGAIRSRLAAMAEADYGIDLLDPAMAFCDERTCYAAIDGVAMYFDNNHPSVDGARRIADLVADRRRLVRND